MKKNFSLVALLLSVIVLLFVFACEGPEGPKGADGRDGQDGQDGQDGTLVPTISTIAANPAIITVGDTTTLMLNVSYSGDATLYYNWSPSSGRLIGGGLNPRWIAPDEPGSYVVTVSVVAGEHTSQGAVSILVKMEESDPVYSYSAVVQGPDGEDISPVLVYEDSDNFVESTAGGFYELYSMNLPTSLTFYRDGYEAKTIDGLSIAPNIKLREKVAETINYYSIMVRGFNMMWYPDSISWSVGSTCGRTGDFVRSSLGHSEPFDVYFLLDSIPEGEWQFYVKAHDLNNSYMGVSSPITVNSDITDTTRAIDVEMMAHKHMPVRTLLQFPTGPIDRFIVEAYIDSTIIPHLPPIPRGYMVLNWDHWHRRSVRDSIRITGGFLLDNYSPVEIFRYHVQARVWGMDGASYAIKTIRDVPWGSYWLSIDMRGAIPNVRASASEGGEIVFNIDGNGDVYCVELFYEDDTEAYTYHRFWKGLTQRNRITLPELPPSYEVYPWGGRNIYYRVTSFVDPYFDIDDYDLDAITERELSRIHELFPEETRLYKRPPGKRLIY